MFGEQICVVVKCVDLANSYDAVFDEVLCVEKFEVDVFCSFAYSLLCSSAFPAVESVWMRRFSLLQTFVSCRKFLRRSPSLTPVQIA